MTNNVVAVIRARLNLPDAEAFIHAFAPMISPGGMFVRTRRLKEVGATIRFEFSLANGERLLLGEGIVRQVRDGSDSPAGMLVKFTKLNRASKNLVDRVVAHKRAQSATVASAPVTPVAAQRPVASAPEKDVLPLTLPGTTGLSEDEALEDRDDPPSAGRIVSPGRVLSALRQQTDEEHEAQPPGVQINEPAGSGESQRFSFGLDESEVDDVLGNLFGSMDNDEGPSLGALDSGGLRDPSTVGVVNHVAPAEDLGDGEAAPAKRRHAQVPFSDTLHAYPVPVETVQPVDTAVAAITGVVSLSAPDAVEAGVEAVAAAPEVVTEHDEAMMSASANEFEGDGAEEVADAEVESPEPVDTAADHTMTWRSGDIHKAVEGRLRVDEGGGRQALSGIEAVAASQGQRDDPEAVPFQEIEAQDDDDIMAVDIDLSDFDGDARGETSDDESVGLADESGDRLVDEPDEVTEPFASGLPIEQDAVEGVALDDVGREVPAQYEEGGVEPGEAEQIDPGELSEPAFPNEYMDVQPSSAQPEGSGEVAQSSFSGGGEAAASMVLGEAPLMEDDDAQSYDGEAAAAEDADQGEDSPAALSAEGAESDATADALEGDGEAIEGGEPVEDSEAVESDAAEGDVDGEDEEVAFEDVDLEDDAEGGEAVLVDVFADDSEDIADVFEGDGGSDEVVESPELVASGGAEDGAGGEEEGVAFEDAADAQAADEGERSSLDEVSIDVEAPLSGESDEASPLEDDDGIAPFIDEEDDEDEGAFDSGGAQLISTMGDGAVSGLGRSSEVSSALIESVSALQALDLPPEESTPAPRPVPSPTASRELGSLLDEIHGKAGQKPASASDLLSGLNLATQPGKGLETLSEEPSELEDEGTPSFEGLLSAVRKEIDARDQDEDEEQADDGDALLDQVLKDSTRIAPPRPANFDIPTPAESDLLGNKKRKRGFFSRFFGGDE